MSINVPSIYVQEYTSNITLLLQQQGSMLRNTVMPGSHSGEQAAVVDQVAPLEMNEVISRFAPMPRADVEFDRRWVAPQIADLTQMLDSFDKLKLLSDPESAMVMTAVNAAGKNIDKKIIAAFRGAALTGKQGLTSKPYLTAANDVAVSVGGANSRINMKKIKEVKKKMMANFIDFDREEAYIGITAEDHEALLEEIEVTSGDFTNNMVLDSGKVTNLLGFRLVHCELLETQAAAANVVHLPVWVKSGMHLGIWGDVSNSVSQRNDLQGEPWQVYTKLMLGATRIEENRVYGIDSYRP